MDIKGIDTTDIDDTLAPLGINAAEIHGIAMKAWDIARETLGDAFLWNPLTREFQTGVHTPARDLDDDSVLILCEIATHAALGEYMDPFDIVSEFPSPTARTSTTSPTTATPSTRRSNG